jgi:AFG3 family protein
VCLLFAGSSKKEINWHEFKRNYLEPGKVESLTVVNKNTVRVHLSPKFAGRDGAGGVFFTIGSVETFEHNLEMAQQDSNNGAGAGPDEMLPVT